MRGIWEYLRKPEGYFPPGYEYEKEQSGGVLLFGIGIVLSFQFFGKLYDTVQALYEYVDYKRVLKNGAVAVSFDRLVTGHWGLYIPFLLFLTGMMVYHYFYYHQETKSIYLMRRLPKRGVVLGSCVKGPLIGLALGAAVLAVLYLLYYGIYLLAIPGECLP